MDITLQPLRSQVVVILGASSGIGLVTAKLAARRGARVVLAARNERDLARAVEEIERDGGLAVFQVADVAEEKDVEAVADRAVQEFGRIDTWVNNAGVGVWGRVMDVSVEDMRRQFDVIYWGTVYGSRAAVPHLRRRGGALINVASAVADRAIPLQGNYCAAKHAVKGFTDTLRMELEEERAPISVTLVKPSSVDTPLFEKAKTYMGVEPQPVPPVYTPDVVAETILHCAEHAVRDVIAGGMGKILGMGDDFPRIADKYMEKTTFESQKTSEPAAESRPSNLYAPVADDGGERGKNWSGRTGTRSLYTKASLHPRMVATVAAIGVGVVLAGLARSRRSRSESPESEWGE